MFIPIPNLALASRRARQRLPALTSFMEQWDPATMPTMPCGLCMRFSPWTVHLSGFSSSLSHEFLSNWGYSWLFQDLWSMNHLNQPDHPQFELSIWLSDFGISIVQQRKGPLLVAAASRHTLWTPWRIHLVLRPKSTNIQQCFMMFHSCVSCIAIVYLYIYITTILSAKLVKIMWWSNITSLGHGSQVRRVAKPQHGPFRHN